jgi:membrane associated rhomboid family serine protease
MAKSVRGKGPGGGGSSLRGRFAGMRITRGALYLLFAEVGLSLIYLASQPAVKAQMESWLTATPHQVWGAFKLWTLVTSPLLQTDVLGLLLDGLLLWMFLPQLERWWGTNRFLRFALYTSLAGTIGGTLVGLLIGREAAISGLAPFVYSSIVAFGVLYANQQVQFFGVLPMTGKQMTIGIIGFVTVFIVIGQEWAKGAAYASAMLLSWLLTTGRWNPRLWLLKLRQRRARRHLQVVRGGNDKAKKWVN